MTNPEVTQVIKAFGEELIHSAETLAEVCAPYDKDLTITITIPLAYDAYPDMYVSKTGTPFSVLKTLSDEEQK